MDATTGGSVYGKCRCVQTPNDTRKQYASRAYRQQHRQIVPSATTRNAHTNTVRVCTQLSLLTSPQSIFTAVIGLRRLRLLGEPTSRHTRVRAGWSSSLNDITFALPVHARVQVTPIVPRVKSTIFAPCQNTTTFLPTSRGCYVHRNSDWASTRVQSGWLTLPSGKCSQTANYRTRMVFL